MTIVKEELGKKIRKLRLERKLTQEDLAEKAELDYTYINQIENGKRNPGVETVSKIAKALGMPLKDLFE